MRGKFALSFLLIFFVLPVPLSASRDTLYISRIQQIDANNKSSAYSQMAPFFNYVNKIIGEKNSRLSNSRIGQASATFKVNVDNYSFGVSHTDADRTRLYVYNAASFVSRNDNDFFAVYNLKTSPSALCYSPDALYIIICNGDGKVEFRNVRTNASLFSLETKFPANKAYISQDWKCLALTNGKNLEIWDTSERQFKKSFSLNSDITCISFSYSGNFMAVMTSDGRMSVYNARTMELLNVYDNLGEAISCAVHFDGKYIAVATSGNGGVIINRLDENERFYFTSPNDSIIDVQFVKDKDDVCRLAIHTRKSVGYALVSAFSPYYSKLISDELNLRMEEWMKRMDGESIEEFNARVNDKTSLEQMLLFEQEITSRLADNILQMSSVKIGGYNTATSILTIDFGMMPSIYLTVPYNEINSFSDASQIQFKNPVYGVTSNDRLELIYVEVLNTSTGLSYVFDNRSRRTLDYLKLDENYVPLEFLKKSNMDEIKLNEIKDQVIAEATQTKMISNHTNINVATHIDTDFDSKGNKILNYRVGVSYDVEAGFSANEDYGPGKYRIEESGAAMSMLAILKKALGSDFAPYFKSAKSMKVVITGTADSSPIVRTISYDDCYGAFENMPVWKQEGFRDISVSKKTGIQTNEQLALIRAAGLKNFIESEVASLNTIAHDYQYKVEVSNKSGAEYRRISVEFVFVDAF